MVSFHRTTIQITLPKLAVYDEIRINVKNHHIPETSRVEIADGLTSEPKKKNNR